MFVPSSFVKTDVSFDGLMELNNTALNGCLALYSTGHTIHSAYGECDIEISLICVKEEFDESHLPNISIDNCAIQEISLPTNTIKNNDRYLQFNECDAVDCNGSIANLYSYIIKYDVPFYNTLKYMNDHGEVNILDIIPSDNINDARYKLNNIFEAHGSTGDLSIRSGNIMKSVTRLFNSIDIIINTLDLICDEDDMLVHEVNVITDVLCENDNSIEEFVSGLSTDEINVAFTSLYNRYDLIEKYDVDNEVLHLCIIIMCRTFYRLFNGYNTNNFIRNSITHAVNANRLYIDALNMINSNIDIKKSDEYINIDIFMAEYNLIMYALGEAKDVFFSYDRIEFSINEHLECTNNDNVEIMTLQTELINARDREMTLRKELMELKIGKANDELDTQIGFRRTNSI